MREVRLVPETLSADVISAGSIPNSPALRESVLSCKLSRYRNVSILKGMFRNKIGAHVSILLCNYDPRKVIKMDDFTLEAIEPVIEGSHRAQLFCRAQRRQLHDDI
jgi:hypothetical protein